MRITIIIAVTACLFTACKKQVQQSMTVIKGCEGSYLRLNNLDYTICNEEALDSYSPGTVIRASLKRDDNCVTGRIHCAMVHDYSTAPGTYQVANIK